MAQEAVTAPVDEASAEDAIVVTGIRGAINNSVQAKKNNTSIVEVISAEDIGKLPDLSIAEITSTKIGRAHVELQSLMRISYAVFCLKKKKKKEQKHTETTKQNKLQIE